jgi:hypothetical protein
MKSHGSGLWITGPRLAFGAWWTHDHGAMWPLRGSEGHRDRSEIERERRSSGFLPMAPLGGATAEMSTRRRSTKVDDGAPMGRWFWARGGEIGTGVSAIDNGAALVALFIGP